MVHAADLKHEVEAFNISEAGYASKGLVEPKYMGTIADQRDMNVLGRAQVLRVSLPMSIHV